MSSIGASTSNSGRRSTRHAKSSLNAVESMILSAESSKSKRRSPGMRTPGVRQISFRPRHLSFCSTSHSSQTFPGYTPSVACWPTTRPSERASPTKRYSDGTIMTTNWERLILFCCHQSRNVNQLGPILAAGHAIKLGTWPPTAQLIVSTRLQPGATDSSATLRQARRPFLPPINRCIDARFANLHNTAGFSVPHITEPWKRPFPSGWHNVPCKYCQSQKTFGCSSG